jgi:hypothetical protein
MQDMLNRISWAGYSGSYLVGGVAAVPGGAGIAMTVISTNKLLNQSSNHPAGGAKMNTGKLLAMGVHPGRRYVYQQRGVFAARANTFCSRPGGVNGVADRGGLIRLSLATQSPTIAFSASAKRRCMPATTRRWRPWQIYPPRTICREPRQQWRVGGQLPGRLYSLDRPMAQMIMAGISW